MSSVIRKTQYWSTLEEPKTNHAHKYQPDSGMKQFTGFFGYPMEAGTRKLETDNCSWKEYNTPLKFLLSMLRLEIS